MATSPDKTQPLPPGRKQWHNPHRKRVNREATPPSSVRPLETVPLAWETLEALEAYRYLTGPQLGDLLLLGQSLAKGRMRSTNPTTLTRAINGQTLVHLKDLGLVKPVLVWSARYRRVATEKGEQFEQKTLRHEVNVLTRSGHGRLRAHHADQGRTDFPYRWSADAVDVGDRFMAHPLLINQAIIHARLWANEHDCTFESAYDDAQTKGLAKAGQAFLAYTGFSAPYPDAVVILRTPSGRRQPYFIEIDRGTEPVTGDASNSWETKMRRYGYYLKHLYRQEPFFHGCSAPLVLTLTTTLDRLHSLRTATEACKNGSAYWFTTLDVLQPALYDFYDLPWLVATCGDETRRLCDESML